MEYHPGAVEYHPRAMEYHPGAVEYHPGAVNAHPGAMEAHPGDMVNLLVLCKNIISKFAKIKKLVLRTPEMQRLNGQICPFFHCLFLDSHSSLSNWNFYFNFP